MICYPGLHLRNKGYLVTALRMDDGQQHQCRSCGKVFGQARALSNHLQHCRKSRNRFQQALAGTRRVWAEGEGSRKRAKFTHSTDAVSVGELGQSMMGDNSRDLIVSQLLDLSRNSLANAKIAATGN
jgi:hypothetical protein